MLKRHMGFLGGDLDMVKLKGATRQGIFFHINQEQFI